MSEIHLTLTANERDLLIQILSAAVKQKRLEVHRTEFSREMRHELDVEEKLIEGLLERVSKTAKAP
ncbi:MAG: hypothetical protein ABUL64_02300 [Singulisphaera sp.]